MKSAQKIIISIFVMVFLCLNTFGAGSLDACGSVNSAGLWTITQDINDGATANCISIDSDDVILDCQGHRINSTNNVVGNFGIFISATRTNLTVQNCEVSNWGDFGSESGLGATLGATPVNDLTIRNSIFRDNYNGIATNPLGGVFINLTTFDNANDGIYISSFVNSINNLIKNINTYNNGGSGFVIQSHTNSVFENINSYNNQEYGIDYGGHLFIVTTYYAEDNVLTNLNLTNNMLGGFNFRERARNTNISNSHISDNTGENIRFGNTFISNNQIDYTYVDNASQIDGTADWGANGNTFNNMFWDNISLFDPCDSVSSSFDVCDNNPNVYVPQSEQIRVELLEYIDQTVVYSPLESQSGQYAGPSENFSYYNLTGYLVVTNMNPNNESLSDIYINLDHSTNVTLPEYYSGRSGSWSDSNPIDGSLTIHIPELLGGENSTYRYGISTVNIRPPLNVTSNYSDTKLLSGGNLTIRDTLSNQFDAYEYQGDVCIRDITLTQQAQAVNFTGIYYYFEFDPDTVNGSDYNHVTTSTDNRTQTWNVFDGGCLYSNNVPYITYNLSTPYNVPTSTAFEAVNTTLNYTIDTTVSGLRVTGIRGIGEEGLSFEKQIVEASDPILYGSNVTWNVSGYFTSDSDISYVIDEVSFWVSQRNFNGSYTDPNSIDNDSISNIPLTVTYTPNNLSNTLNPWSSDGWLFNYSDIPSPIVWMDVNMSIRNDYYQLINRTVTQNGDDYHIKEIYLIIGYWLEVEKNISVVGPDTYQIRLDVHNKGNQVTPADSIVTIYDFVPSNFALNGSFDYSISPWYTTANTSNNVTGDYDGVLYQFAIIPSNAIINTSFAEGPSKNVNTTWSATYNVTGSGDYTLLDVFITGLDPQKVDGAGSTRAVIVEEFIDKLKSTEGIFAVIATIMLVLGFLV